jgi:hypothetical protein
MMSASGVVVIYPSILVLCSNSISNKVNENIEHLEIVRYTSSITCLFEGFPRTSTLQLRTTLPYLTHVLLQWLTDGRLTTVKFYVHLHPQNDFSMRTPEFIDGAM